jgi:enoyl-CoA hydratase/carnithine racemase
MLEVKYLSVVEESGIVTVGLNQEDRLNVLSSYVMKELKAVAQHYKSSAHVRAVILRGADKFFSAGADLLEASEKMAKSAEVSLLERREENRLGPEMCKAWEEMEPVTIAAIEGYCVGGGCALVLACDFRIASQSVMMRLPEVPLGMNMSWHSIPRLTTMLGPSRAKRFTIFGEPTYAETLKEWGMVDELVENGCAYNEAKAWALKAAGLPPLPVRMTKESINAAANALHQASTFMDRDQHLLTLLSEDLKEGVTAFVERREPSFEGN